MDEPFLIVRLSASATVALKTLLCFAAPVFSFPAFCLSPSSSFHRLFKLLSDVALAAVAAMVE
jgi:hypothetical protein